MKRPGWLQKPIPVPDDSIPDAHRLHEAIPPQRIKPRLAFGREIEVWILIPEMGSRILDQWQEVAAPSLSKAPLQRVSNSAHHFPQTEVPYRACFRHGLLVLLCAKELAHSSLLDNVGFTGRLRGFSNAKFSELRTVFLGPNSKKVWMPIRPSSAGLSQESLGNRKGTSSSCRLHWIAPPWIGEAFLWNSGELTPWCFCVEEGVLVVICWSTSSSYPEVMARRNITMQHIKQLLFTRSRVIGFNQWSREVAGKNWIRNWIS